MENGRWCGLGLRVLLRGHTGHAPAHARASRRLSGAQETAAPEQAYPSIVVGRFQARDNVCANRFLDFWRDNDTVKVIRLPIEFERGTNVKSGAPILPA